MASTSRARICDLPDEVLLFIFSSLPVADLARCAATCERFHNIVTRFPHLWKDKKYRSDRNPTECAETHAVLDALPALQKVSIKMYSGFLLSVSYPSLVFSDKYIGVMKDRPRLRCNSLKLSIPVPIARDVLTVQSTIDLERLQQLVIWPSYFSWVTEDYSSVVCTAMRLCPRLRSLRLGGMCLRAEDLDAVQEFVQLQTLEIRSARLSNLSFLRHCSGTLEDLQLLACDGLPPWEFSKLSQLQNLQRLWLRHCRFEERALAAAMAGLAKLESLRLDMCSVVRDLSILKHCGRLRELHITNSYSREDQVNVTPGGQKTQLHDLRLPTDVNSSREVLFGVGVTGDELSGALRRLEELGLKSSCLAYLSAMRHCSQLRHLCFEFESTCNPLVIFNVRIYITLTRSTQS